MEDVTLEELENEQLYSRRDLIRYIKKLRFRADIYELLSEQRKNIIDELMERVNDEL